jgi:hypothetical protein
MIGEIGWLGGGQCLCRSVDARFRGSGKETLCSIRLDPDIESRLSELGKRTGRPKFRYPGISSHPNY